MVPLSTFVKICFWKYKIIEMQGFVKTERNRYCTLVLTLTKAVRPSILSLFDRFLFKCIKSCKLDRVRRQKQWDHNPGLIEQIFILKYYIIKVRRSTL